MSNFTKGILGKCYLKGHYWGECTCKTEVSEDEGFSFEGTCIVDPMLNENATCFVNPEIYYGDAYRNWKANQ